MLILYSKPGVFLKLEDTEIEGYLCLGKTDEYLLLWTTIDSLPNPNIMHDIHQQTLRFDFGQTFSRAPTDVPLLEYVATNLSTISRITIDNELTLSNNRETCMGKIVVYFDETNWPDLWTRQPRDLFILDLRLWLRTVQRDLQEQDGFKITTELQPLPQDRWPDNLPRPPRVVQNFSQMGLSLVSDLAGQTMANKLEDLGWNVLERFSRVTNIAKDTTTKVLHTEFARPFLPLIPTQVRSVFLSSSEVEALLQDYDSAEHYLARFANEIQARMSRPKTGIRELDTTRDYEQLKQHRIAHFTGQSVMREQFQSWFDADGTLTKSKEEIYSLVFCGGIEPGLRTELYKYILGYYPFESTGFEREQIAIDKQKQYRELLASWQDILSECDSLSPTRLEAPQVGTVGDENQNADVVGRLKERKYRIDKDVVRTDRNVAYFEARENAGSPPPIETYPHLLELRHILMTYTMLDFETGYVQGMSDLASPLLTCLPEEAEAFWCFNGFMQRMKPNFLRDQSGMRTQLRQLELLIKLVDYPLYELMEQTDATNLFCCFRWLLILFKREFEFEEIKFLWEIIWTCPLTKHFHLFIALAILNQQRQELMQCQAFDEVLKTVNDLSGKISPVESVQRAQVLFYCFRDYFLHYGPQDLVTNLPINQLNQHDQLLAQTSGVNTNLDMVLDKLDVKLTNDEWNELAMLFESNL